MGSIRNGARSFLNGAQQLCKFSRMPGFRAGLNTILGPEDATILFTAFEPFCVAVDALIALDNFYNQIDIIPDAEDDEDGPTEL